jgi:hypothetical protein
MTNVYHKSSEIIVEAIEEREEILPQTTDDLTEIKGIGLGTAERLKTMKVYTYRQLAELTPEKLSEAPGIGIATARKFIEEAKNLLSEFQEQNSAKKQNHIIEKTTEILKKEKKTDVDNIINFEVAEVIVEEELPQEKLQREEIPIESIQKPWFREKFNRSRLSASYSAVSKRSPIESIVVTEEIEEIESETKAIVDFEEREEETIEEYQETVPEVPERLDVNATVEPFESEVPFIEEPIPREEAFAPIATELPKEIDVSTIAEFLETPEVVEVPNIAKIAEIPEVFEVPEVHEIIEVPTRPKVPNYKEELTNEVAESLKELGYYSIPRGIEALAPFFRNVDSIGLRLVSVKNNSKLIILAPIKFCDLEGTILVHEDKIDYKAYSKAPGSGLVSTARQHADELLRTKDSMFEEVVNGEVFRSFVEKYLQVRFAVEKSAKNKKLYFLSGQTQYKILIEPILLTKTPAKCMEKSILFPYQRKTNLHIVDRTNLGHLLRFIEKKYKLIESRAKKTNSIEIYQTADAKFRSSLKVASLPFLGYSVVLLVIYFSQLYFLLRLLNSIGVAAIGIYVFAVAYFYFKFYNTKKELTTEFETPYYLQNAQFSETDLLIVKEEFTSEQMAQFGYECFGKDSDSKVLKEIEKNSIKESVVAKQREQVAPDLFELDSHREDSSVAEVSKNDVKFSSFLED